MIELRKKKSTTNNETYEVFIGNEVIAEVGAREVEDELDIQLNEKFNFDLLLKRVGKCKIENFICYLRRETLPFNLIAKVKYNWEKFFFNYQALWLENINSKTKLYIHFGNNEEDSSNWTYKYSMLYVLKVLSSINHEKVNIITYDLHLSATIELKKEFITTLLASYNELKKAIYEVEQELYKRLENFKWKEDYHTDEPKFTKEVMIPLLKKMKYKNVRYNHGVDEHGKDVIFSEINKFGEEIFYAVQVKAGDISGGANSDINTLVNQAKRAFTMPFKLLGEKHERHLSFFIIAISGHFTRTAKDVIVEQIERPYKQNVFFWDKDKIEDLTGTYWKAD